MTLTNHFFFKDTQDFNKKTQLSVFLRMNPREGLNIQIKRDVDYMKTR